MRSLFKRNINLLLHILFWVASFKVLYDLFRDSDGTSKTDIIYTSVFLITLMIPVYINLRILIPLLFSKNRYLLYALSFIGLIPLFSLFNHFTFNKLIDFIFPGYYFISYYDLTDLSKFMLVFLSLTSLLKLSKSWFLVNEAKKKLALAEKEKIHNELLALKSQIHPHFMFNSLNNIYSLAMKKSDKAPGAIISLGNILRYTIYQGAEEKVELADEIRILQQFIELQSLRFKGSKVEFGTDIENKKSKIAPLVFLPLIENGFKHGIKGDVKGGFLKINLVEKKGEIFFSIINNKGVVDSVEDPKLKGIGLDNVRRRLEISYPGSHEFKVFNEEDTFRVELKIMTNE